VVCYRPQCETSRLCHRWVIALNRALKESRKPKSSKSKKDKKKSKDKKRAEHDKSESKQQKPRRISVSPRRSTRPDLEQVVPPADFPDLDNSQPPQKSPVVTKEVPRDRACRKSSRYLRQRNFAVCCRLRKTMKVFLTLTLVAPSTSPSWKLYKLKTT